MLNLPRIFYRGTLYFSMFRIKTLIYFGLISILVMFLKFTTTPSNDQKLPIKTTEQLVQSSNQREETLYSTAGASCQPLHFIPHAELRPAIALASFPGSGNTWVRHLIQQSTGILTGSEGLDEEFLFNGFPGEGVFNASVAVVKTHELLSDIIDVQYQKAVLLIRHPKPTFQANFNLYTQGHTGCVTKEDYEFGFGVYWKYFVENSIPYWERMNMDWIKNFKGPLHIVLYEDLKNDLGPTLRSLVQFLDLPLNETAIQCTVENNEGLYHRKPCPYQFQPFPTDMNEAMVAAEAYVFGEVDKFKQSKRKNNIT